MAFFFCKYHVNDVNHTGNISVRPIERDKKKHLGEIWDLTKFNICRNFFLLFFSPNLNTQNLRSDNKIVFGNSAQTLSDATPPLCKTPPFTIIAVTFEPMKRFRCPSIFESPKKNET